MQTEDTSDRHAEIDVKGFAKFGYTMYKNIYVQ